MPRCRKRQQACPITSRGGRPSSETAASSIARPTSVTPRPHSGHRSPTTATFPFLIEGEPDGLGLHAINGCCPIATEPASIDAEPWRLTNARSPDVLIAGFFAPDAAGVMTHHGTAIHAHAVLSVDAGMITGHVDRVVAPGMTLRLPMTN